MVETCRSVFRLDEIAGAAQGSRLSAWVMGTNDLAKEMRARQTPGREPFHAALGLAVAAARANGLVILDGVYNGIDDDVGFEAVCEQGVDFGFDGKTLIHPRQVDICNRVFSPSDADVASAASIRSSYPALTAVAADTWSMPESESARNS